MAVQAAAVAEAISAMQPVDGDYDVTPAIIAAAADVSTKEIRLMVQAGHIKKFTRGQYRLFSTLIAILRHNRRLIISRSLDETLEGLRKESLRKDIELKEIDIAKARGRLLDASEVRKSVIERAQVVRAAIESIPPRISALLAAESDPHRCRMILAGELRDALQKLSDE